jgi:leucyl aminopeptidase (aminopeptidase T)
MKNSDVFIAPTKKSISHTAARINANKAGARGATLPGITEEVWKSSLQADYSQVGEITDTVWDILAEHEEIRVKTPSGTDLRLWVDMEYFDKDIGLIHEAGDFGNLPAGEVDGGVLKAEGTLVIDHAPFLPEDNESAELEIKGTEVVAVKNAGQKLRDAFDKVEGSRNIAEFGFGTNPEATLIGNILQDEKVLGTIHIAFGDNTSYFPESHERHSPCEIHWDFVSEKPTVWFGDEKVLDSGEPQFDY